MRALRVWLIYLAVVFLGGALLAPWLWHGAQAMAVWHPVFGGVAQVPFHRFVNRAMLILALVGMWPTVRSLGLCSWADWGFRWGREEGRRMAVGFLLGWLSMGAIAAATMVAEVRVLNDPLWAWALVGNLGRALGAAVGVSLIEETLFRGALQSSLGRAGGFGVGLVLSSGLYALVHFFARVRWEGAVEWTTGLVVLGQMSRGLVDAGELVPGFLVLFVAGLILGVARGRTGSLAGSLGLHAGWVFWLKAYGAVSHEVPGRAHVFWGTSRLTDGWLALLVLGVLLMVVVTMGLDGGRRSSAEPGPAGWRGEVTS